MTTRALHVKTCRTVPRRYGRALPPTRSCTEWSGSTWRPFLAAAAARTDGVGLPSFTEREFRAFVRCGLLVHGFLRVRCDDCAFERLVPLSCKGRAVCASCGGRRMARNASFTNA
jgi:hypothetical protein